MNAAEVVGCVRTDLRITHAALDGDIYESIVSCLEDMQIVGIQTENRDDGVILAAVKLYCRAAYTDDTDKAAAYMSRYNAMKATLMMAEGYRGARDE